MTKNITNTTTFANALPAMLNIPSIEELLRLLVDSAANLRSYWLTKEKGYVPSYIEARGGEAVVDYKENIDTNIKKATSLFKYAQKLFREEVEYYGICCKADLFYRFDYNSQKEQARLAVEILALNAEYGIIAK